MSTEQKPKKRGCLMKLGCGCLAVVVLAAVLVVLVLLNLDRIKSTALYQRISAAVASHRATLGHLSSLQAELAEGFPAEDIQVKSMSHFGSPDKSLQIAFVNPSFGKGGAPDWKPKAREIAVFAAERYGAIDDVDLVLVTIIKSKGMGVTFTTTESYPFHKTDLLPQDPAHP